MAITERLRLQSFSVSDAEGLLALSREAGWNQTSSDWDIFFACGEVFGFRDDDRIVASGAVLPYREFGWISMVLTTASHRGRGLATAILRQAIETLQEGGRVPMLDATPAGEPVYRPLGFVGTMPIWRWRGAGSASAPFPTGPLDPAAIHALDEIAFGSPRRVVIASLLARSSGLAAVEDGSFLLARTGRTATQIGPVVARDGAAAQRLLAGALNRASGPLLIDVPEGRHEIETLLEGSGFTRERPYLRMRLGAQGAFGVPAMIHAIAGPELG